SLVTAGSSSLATGSTDDLAGEEPTAEAEGQTPAADGATPEPATQEPAADPTSVPAVEEQTEGGTTEPRPAADADDEGAATAGETKDAGQVGAVQTPDAGEPADAPVVPMAVPQPGSRNSVITVRVGGDRTGTSGAAGVQGVTLRLYEDGSNGPTRPVDAGWATCVSDSAGDCSFVVPETHCDGEVFGVCWGARVPTATGGSGWSRSPLRAAGTSTPRSSPAARPASSPPPTGSAPDLSSAPGTPTVPAPTS